MKDETIKEFGKLFYDFAKIGLAVAVITPLRKGVSETHRNSRNSERQKETERDRKGVKSAVDS